MTTLRVEPAHDALGPPMALSPIRAAPMDSQVVAESRRILAAKGRTFRAASLLLPRDTRDDAAVVYAFCRLADDTVDESDDVAASRLGLERLRLELRGEASPRPIVAAFLDVCSRHAIPLAAAEHLLNGMERDLETVLALEDDRALLRYAYEAAGTVGLMMARLLGAHEEAALAHAVDLGIAMQLTNICRDVAEDAGRQRTYLPESRLAAAGLSARTLRENVGRDDGRGELARDAVFPVVRDLLELAERYYQSGLAGLSYLPLRPRRTILAAGTMYRAIGSVVLEGGPQAMRERAIVGWFTKCRYVLRAVRMAPKVTAVPHDAALHRYLGDLPGCRAHSALAPERPLR
jgi:phytoene synthase